MDLNNIETYLRPQTFQDVNNWETGWMWLAGGSWIFSEAQPQLKTLVDMQQLGWSELEITPEGLTIGATCIMSQLLQLPEDWTAVKALKSAVQELASFKVQNVATVAGNLCLALPASTFAPVMVALDANYEILPRNGSPYWVSALDFQIGAKQTILKPGDVLRRIFISCENLQWEVNYQRICVATAGLAISIVVAATNPKTSDVRFGIGGAVPFPRLIQFNTVPSSSELSERLHQEIPLSDFIEDRTSRQYRRHVTEVLMKRSLE